MTELCPICKGRGEVEMGITVGKFCGYENGIPRREAVKVYVNPAAWDKKRETIWILEPNQYVPLWGIAICMECRGTGMTGFSYRSTTDEKHTVGSSIDADNVTSPSELSVD